MISGTVLLDHCLGLFSHSTDEHQAYQDFQGSDNKAELSHEVISGAAAYEVRPSPSSLRA
jgi:hypothetical protein